MSNIKHPAHYTKGTIETIDHIRDILTPEMFLGFCLGNVIKYISRWQDKNGAEDLRKASVYLNWAIESAESTDVSTIYVQQDGTYFTQNCAELTRGQTDES